MLGFEDLDIYLKKFDLYSSIESKYEEVLKTAETM